MVQILWYRAALEKWAEFWFLLQCTFTQGTLSFVKGIESNKLSKAERCNVLSPCPWQWHQDVMILWYHNIAMSPPSSQDIMTLWYNSMMSTPGPQNVMTLWYHNIVIAPPGSQCHTGTACHSMPQAGVPHAATSQTLVSSLVEAPLKAQGNYKGRGVSVLCPHRSRNTMCRLGVVPKVGAPHALP